MAWLWLVLAGLLEIVWATAMKQVGGGLRALPVLVMLAAMAGSFGLLAVAMRSLPLGTAYMAWTGIGAVGSFAVGAAFLGEAVTPMRAAAAALILLGVLVMQAAQ